MIETNNIYKMFSIVLVCIVIILTSVLLMNMSSHKDNENVSIIYPVQSNSTLIKNMHMEGCIKFNDIDTIIIGERVYRVMKEGMYNK